MAEDLGPGEWDDFVAQSGGGWFWHTSRWRDYTLAYRPDLASRSLAFALRDAGRMVAAVPLFLERSQDGENAPVATGGGDPCWSPAIVSGLSDRARERVLVEALERAEDLVVGGGATSIEWRVSPLAASLGDYALAFTAVTIRLGYSDRSSCSRVIDLSAPITRLHTDMTKGHRADVKRGLSLMDIEVLDGNTMTAQDFAAYRTMHARAAGRVTRPTATFDLMQRWVHEGKAVLIGARSAGIDVGFAYILVDRGCAYYASAANSPDAGSLPIGHALQGRAIEYLKSIGCGLYELGQQHYEATVGRPPTAKEVAISRFKRGFGGVTLPIITRHRTLAGQAGHRTLTAGLSGGAG